MGLVTTIGNAIKSVFTKKKEISVNKETVADAIATRTALMADIISLIDTNKAGFETIGKDLRNAGNNPPEDIKQVNNAYKALCKILNPRPMQDNSRMALGAFYSAAKLVISDLQDLSKNLDTVFNSDNDVLTEADLRASHLAVLGYLELTYKMSNWFTYFLAQYKQADAHTHPYQIDYLYQTAEDVAKFINVVMEPSGRLMTVLNGMKTAQDVKLITNGSFFNEYARDGDYSRSASAMMSGFIPNPAIVVADILTVWEHNKYLKQKASANFVKARMALLVKQQMGLSPEDPEYQRLQAIVEKYQAELAKIDHQIAQYEGSV